MYANKLSNIPFFEFFWLFRKSSFTSCKLALIKTAIVNKIIIKYPRDNWKTYNAAIDNQILTQ